MDEIYDAPDEQWEQELLERMAEESDPMELLDLAQDAAMRLAVALSDLRHGGETDEVDTKSMRVKIARVAVLLDVLQLRFGDTIDEEIEFLQTIEEAMQ